MILFGLTFQTPPVPEVKVVFLGTGTPRQDPDRSGPAAAVVYGGQAYLVDCGPGVVRRAALAARQGTKELAAPNLKTVFVTHLHSDHTLGYPDLIFSPWVVGRSDPLQAFGPKGLDRMTQNLEAAYAEDIQIRTEGLEHGNRTGYKLNVHEIKPGPIFQSGDLKVTAFPVKHGTWEFAYGYRFQAGSKVIVFSGDTAPSDELIKAAADCDVLVHEVYSKDEFAPENRKGGDDWPTYMKAFHTSATELGKIAAQCHAKALVLTHVLRRKATDADLIEEVRQGGYAGPVTVAKDLDIVTP